ncbi:hypothetical protein BST61_g2277 [Cercospora zeina]
MPVSHLGLTVSHIPSATSFYLAALQPLGYRFIGHQGASIGLGVDSADFFITQAPIGTRPSPNHIAFLAENRNIVRDCYTASLEAGGRPSGSPDYRNADCTCFNAAVEDHDGNTVEFIFRQPHGQGAGCGEAAPSEHSRVLTWRESVDEAGAADDAQSVAKSAISQGSQASKATTVKSRIQTAIDLAKSTAESTKSAAPSQGISRASTAPSHPGSSFPSKTIIGTALGAAAGAALMFALHREEAKNAKEEADHMAYMASRSNAKSRHSVHDVPASPPAPRAETLPPANRALSQAPDQDAPGGRRPHHNYSTTESAYSRPQPRTTRAMRMLQETGYNDDDEVQEVMSRYTNLRPHATRSHAYDPIDYAPDEVPARSTAGSAMKRASTLPVDIELDRPNYYLEAPKTPKSTTSKHGSRYDEDDHRSSASYRSHKSHRSHRRTSADETERLKRHDSGVEVYSSRTHKDRGSDADRKSSASTVKPFRRTSGQDGIPLPPPPIGNNAHSSTQVSRDGGSCYHPAAISLPPSNASSSKQTTACVQDLPEPVPSSRRSHCSPPAVPEKPYIQERDSVLQSWENFEAEESDGMGDVRTVLPEDSISCVDLSESRRRHRRHHHHSSSSKHSKSGRSETSDRTIGPATKEKDKKGSLFGLPIRSKEGSSRFSFTSFASAALRPVQTADPANTIWSAISQDAFRKNLVTLEKRTNAVPMDVLTAKVKAQLDAIAAPVPHLPLRIEKQIADDLAYIAAVGEGAQSVAAVCLEQHIRTSRSSSSPTSSDGRQQDSSLIIVRIAGMDIVDEKVKSMLRQIIDILQDLSRDGSTATTEIPTPAKRNERLENSKKKIFDLMISHHRQKLLGRLRSRKWTKPTYLDRTHKKPLWQDFTNVIHRVQHVFPRKAEWRVRKTVLESVEGLQRMYEMFENTREVETEDKLKNLVKASWEFCQRKDVRAFAEKLEGGEAGRTAQVAAAVKTLRQVEKVAAYWRIARDLVTLARSPYPEVFGSIELEFVRPYASVPTAITYEPWAGKCHVHAEVQLVVEGALSRNDESVSRGKEEAAVVIKPRIIGTSKYLCYLCYLFLHYHGGYEALNSHGRLYDQWTVPDLAEYDPGTKQKFAEVLEEMSRHIVRQIEGTKGVVWRAEPMTSRQNLLSCEGEEWNQDDSVGRLEDGIGTLNIRTKG